MRQIPLAIGLESEPTLDSFVHGENSPAVEHLRGLSPPAAAVYLWGTGGSGKTHLLQAFAARCRSAGQVVGWFDAEDPLPWRLDPQWTAVLLDRCEALPPEQQHAAFALFEETAARGVQFLAAGRLPPVDLPLGDAETRAALRREADRRGIFLGDEVMDYLLTRFDRDLGHLMRQLDRLDTFGLAKGRRITVPLVREMLSEEGVDVQPLPDGALR